MKINSLEAEQSVLGCILIDNDVDITISADDFYEPAHVTIFKAMMQLKNNHAPIDLITVKEQLGKNIDKIG